jgi:hypothetical protein
MVREECDNDTAMATRILKAVRKRLEKHFKHPTVLTVPLGESRSAATTPTGSRARDRVGNEPQQRVDPMTPERPHSNTGGAVRPPQKGGDGGERDHPFWLNYYEDKQVPQARALLKNPDDASNWQKP